MTENIIVPADRKSEINRLLIRSWKYHQEALEGMEKVKLAMELSELELEAAMQLSAEDDYIHIDKRKRA